MFNLFRHCRKDEILYDIVAETGNIVAKKRQQCRSNIRHCRKNRSTCSVQQCCFDIVASMDGASVLTAAVTRALQPSTVVARRRRWSTAIERVQTRGRSQKSNC